MEVIVLVFGGANFVAQAEVPPPTGPCIKKAPMPRELQIALCQLLIWINMEILSWLILPQAIRRVISHRLK